MLRNCLHCNDIFEAPDREVKRGYGKFCSQSHSSKYFALRRPKIGVEVKCGYCEKVFLKSESRMKKAKHGFYFCCKEHKDLAQRIGGIKEIQPSHFGVVAKKYRISAFRAYEHKCFDCNYDKVTDILVVHHIDEDRTNNSLSNLVILCPNCHAIRHRHF